MDNGNGKQGFARDLFDLRKGRLKITRDRFAKRFGLTSGTVQNCEQGRHNPSAAMRVLVAAIELDPAFMATAAKVALERWGARDLSNGNEGAENE